MPISIISELRFIEIEKDLEFLANVSEDYESRGWGQTSPGAPPNKDQLDEMMRTVIARAERVDGAEVLVLGDFDQKGGDHSMAHSEYVHVEGRVYKRKRA